MSNSEISCPHCRQVLEASESMAGQTVQCPTCNGTFQVPAAEVDVLPAPPHRRTPAALNLKNLPLPKESTYFKFALVISILVWAVLIITIVPIFYALIGIVAIWFANGLLVAQLRADGVKVDENQLPELHQALREVCAKLQLKVIPELYIFQSGGILNAFATRHSGRQFIVLFSDILEAYGASSAEIKFLLGHEIGHIKRNHLTKRILLFPGLLFPLLGNAYSRAAEATCDRFGAFASEDVDASISAMMILSGGKTAGKLMKPESFAAQHSKMRGFFVSWYELISGYPTLSQRVANLFSTIDGRPPAKAPRNPLAYLFAFFSIGGRGAGGANMLITVAIIGLLAAIAIPSFMKSREMAQHNACINNLRRIESAKEQAAMKLNLTDNMTVSEEQISEFIPGGFAALHCNKGGSYIVQPIGQDAECTEHGTISGIIESQER